MKNTKFDKRDYIEDGENKTRVSYVLPPKGEGGTGDNKYDSRHVPLENMLNGGRPRNDNESFYVTQANNWYGMRPKRYYFDESHDYGSHLVPDETNFDQTKALDNIERAKYQH